MNNDNWHLNLKAKAVIQILIVNAIRRIWKMDVAVAGTIDLLHVIQMKKIATIILVCVVLLMLIVITVDVEQLHQTEKIYASLKIHAAPTPMEQHKLLYAETKT